MRKLLQHLLFLSFLILAPKAYALDYYWVGGTGNWSDINHWSAVSGNVPMQLHTITPTSNDNVILDSLSFPSTGGNITINLNIAFCKNLIIRDIPSNVNIYFYGSSDVLRIFGDIDINDTLNWYGSGQIKLEGTDTNYIKIKGVTLPNLTLNSIGSSWILQDSLSIGTLSALYGTLYSDGNFIQATNLRGYNQTTLNLDGSDIEIRSNFHTDGGVTLKTNGTSLFLDSYGTPSIHDYSVNAHTFERIFCGSDVDISASSLCSVNVLDVTQNITARGSFIVDSLFLDSTTTMIIGSGSSLTLKSIDASGSCGSFIEILSSGFGTKAYINHTSSNTLDYIRTRDIVVTGNPLQVSVLENINQSSTGFNSSTSAQGQKFYWINGNGNWEDANHWSLTEGGSPTTCVPSSRDTVVFSDSSAISSLTIFMPNKEINIASFYANASFSIYFSGNTNNTLFLNGTLSLDSNVTLNRPLTFIGSDSTYTIKTSNNYLRTLTFFGTGKWTLEDDLNANRVHHLNGTFDISSRTVNANDRFSDDTNIPGMSSYLIADSAIIKTNQFLTGNQKTGTAVGSKVWMVGYGPSLSTSSLIEWDTLNFDGSGIGQANQYNDFNVANFNSSCRITGTLSADSVVFSKGKIYRINNLSTSTINAVGDCGANIDFDAHGTTANWNLNGNNETIYYAIIKNTEINNGSLVANGSFDNSGNSGITFNSGTSRILYWVGGTGSWSDSTHWSLISGGLGGECVPTPLDSIIVDANSDTTGSTSWYINLISPSYVKDIHVTSDATLWRITGSYALNVYGSLYLKKSVSLNSTIRLAASNKSEILETSYSWFSRLEVQADSSNFDIIDSLRVSRLYHGKGNLIGNGNYFNIGSYYGDGDTLLNAGAEMSFSSATVNNTWDIPSSDIRVGNNLSLNGNVSSNNSLIELYGNSSSLTLTSSDTINKVLFSNTNGNGRFTGNSNSYIKYLELLGDGTFTTDANCDTLVFSNGHSYYIKESREVAVNEYFDCDGDFCNPILIRSSTQGVQANIYLQDTLSGEFLEIRDINSSGPAPFYAGSKSADQGNNTNIIWANKPGYVWGFGPDKYLITCDGSSNDSVVLPTDGFEDALGFTWFDGSTGTNYTTNAEGVYWVEANYGGCNVPDTIAVFFDTISLDLTSTYFCTGDTMSLAPVRDTFLSHVTLLWNDGSADANKSFQVTADTTVWVQVVDAFGNTCADTIHSNMVSSDLLPDSLSVLNCSTALLDSTVFVNLIGAIPDSVWYTLKSNYDTLNNIYDGMVELSALFNTCVITDSMYIKLDSVGSITPQKNSFCPGTNVTWSNTHLSSNFTPMWFNGVSAQSVTQQVWADSAVYFYRTDDLGNVCGDTLRYSIDTNLVSVALSSWSSSLSTNVLAPYADTLQGNVYGDGNSYYWMINGVIQDSGVGTYDTLAINLVDTGWYSIGFVGYDSIYGCAKYTSLYYYVSTQAGAYIPNAFSPNGDNVNDLWIPVIHSSNPQAIETKIYDSYGNKVFEYTGASISWDGTNPNGVNCNAGTYIVQCNYTDLSGNSVPSITYLTLIR
jgi:gliding motility-associated-like protein